MAQSTDPHLAGDGSRRRSRKVCSISVIAVDDVYPYIGRQGEHAMASQVVQFAGLSDRDRKNVTHLPKLGEGDHVELHVRRRDGAEQTVSLPPAAANAIETLLSRLLSGERVAVIAENQELSPTEASTILGISRPLVVHRMDIGDLPFRYVGKHRRASLKDVLALKAQLDVQRKAMQDLAADAEDLHLRYGI
ncbi:DNA-binding protein [Brucella sp. MAB-22]|nr:MULTISPECIES: DNA-binding protein [Brucella]UYT56260.1 DNA-binding protein [Brucella sp. MAB-22]